MHNLYESEKLTHNELSSDHPDKVTNAYIVLSKACRTELNHIRETKKELAKYRKSQRVWNIIFSMIFLFFMVIGLVTLVS